MLLPIAGLVAATLFWFLDAALDAYVLGSEPLFDALFPTSASEIWMRLTFIVGVGGLSLALYKTALRYRQIAAIVETQETQHRAILDAAGDGIYGIDSEGHISFINATGATLLGYTPSELLGCPEHALLHHSCADGSPHPEAQCPIRAAWKRGEVGSHNNDVFWRQDGTRFNVEYVSTPVLLNDTVQGAIVVFKDISEKGEIEENLRGFAEILETSLNEIFVFDAETFKFLRVNRGARENLGYSMEELTAMTALDIKPEVTPEKFQALIAPLLSREHERVVFNTVHLRKDDSTYPVEVHLQCSTLAGKHVFVAIILDTTERSKAEAARHASEARAQTILSSCIDGVITIGEAGRIQSVNPIAERMFGYSAREMIGQNVKMLMPACEGEKHDGYLERYLKTGEARIIGQGREVTALHKDGHEFPVELAVGETILPDGRVFVGFVRDLSERKRTQEELQYARTEAIAAQAANAAKSEFLANISHEIRTPMTAILGYTEELLDESAAFDAWPEGRNALEVIGRNGNHLLEVINGILDLARLEAGRLEVEEGSVNPRDLIAEVCSMMRGRATEKGVELRMEFAGETPRAISTDPTRLRQILINLIGNAIKFTEQGSITVALRSLLDETKSPSLEFEVTDTGMGMNPEELSHIFAPFSQGDNSMSRNFGGTGLGLTICQRLSELMGAQLSVKSTPGSGSSFRLVLPIRSGAASLTSADVSTSEQAQSGQLHGRILLAEDHLENQQLIQRVLTRWGLEVETASDGRRAVDKALEALESGNPFGVILMDVQMPVMDGIEAVKQLRQQAYELPVIALTGHAMSHEKKRCLSAGFSGFATKPVDKPVLFELIASYLGEQKRLH